jgi:hypothetical protein
MEWGVYPARDGTTHIVPSHDGIHYWPECWCQPIVGDDRVITHHTRDSVPGEGVQFAPAS